MQCPLDKPVNNFLEDEPTGEQWAGWIKDKHQNAKMVDELNAHLVSALQEHPHGKRMANLVRSCSLRVEVKDGKPEVRKFSCNVRMCARCFQRAQAKRRTTLEKVFRKLANRTWEGEEKPLSYLFITLTMAPTPGNNLRHRITKFRAKLTEFLKSKEMRSCLISSYYKIECTQNPHTGHWNVHSHLCVLSRKQRNIVEMRVRSTWRKMAQIIDVRRWRIHEHRNEALELSKGHLCSYLTKPFSEKMSKKGLAQAVIAFKGVRTNGAWGLIRKLIKEAKEEQRAEEMEAIEQEEKKLAELQEPGPEHLRLPDGTYGVVILLEHVMRASPYATWANYCLRIMKWGSASQPKPIGTG